MSGVAELLSDYSATGGTISSSTVKTSPNAADQAPAQTTDSSAAFVTNTQGGGAISPTAVIAPAEHRTPVAAVAGGAAGGAFAVALIIGFSIYYCYHVRKSRESKKEREPESIGGYRPVAEYLSSETVYQPKAMSTSDGSFSIETPRTDDTNTLKQFLLQAIRAQF